MHVDDWMHIKLFAVAYPFCSHLEGKFTEKYWKGHNPFLIYPFIRGIQHLQLKKPFRFFLSSSDELNPSAEPWTIMNPQSERFKLTGCSPGLGGDD